MKGTIQRFNGQMGIGKITGDDGVQYFFHEKDCNTKKIKKSNLVEFDFIDEGKEHLKAINIKKIGLGNVHPFISTLEQIAEFINCPTNDEKEYRLRDIKTIQNWIASLEILPEENVRVKYRPGEVEG